MQQLALVALLALFPSLAAAEERTCALDRNGTGYALKLDLELEFDQARKYDSADLKMIAQCKAFAWGYLQAASEVGEAGKQYVLPSAVSRGQMWEVYLKWARENPAKVHNPAWQCVISAFTEAFGKKE